MGRNRVVSALRDNGRPRWFDWAFWGVIFFLCTFFFNYGDMTITSEHSYDLLSSIKGGDFFSFYEITYNKALAGDYNAAQPNDAANYNIIIYLTLAVWLLPVKAVGMLLKFRPSTGFLSMYCTVFIAVCVLLAGLVLYKLGKKLGMTHERSQWLAFLFLSSNIMLYGTVFFGQLDIFSILTVFIALYFYIDGKYWQFSLVMSVACCYKIFAALVFIPLLLLAEKRILHILKYGAVGISLLVIVRGLAALDPGYSVTQEAMGKIYGFTNRLFAILFPAARMGGVSAFIFCFVLLCFGCYYFRPDEAQRVKWMFCVPLLSYVLFFAFVSWHPQWLSLLAPFTAVCIMTSRRTKALMAANFGLNLSFILYMFTYINSFHITASNFGFLRLFMDGPLVAPSISGKLAEMDLPAGLIIYSVLQACIIAFVLLSFIDKYRQNDYDSPPMPERGLTWASMCPIFVLYIVPSIILSVLKII